MAVAATLQVASRIADHPPMRRTALSIILFAASIAYAIVPAGASTQLGTRSRRTEVAQAVASSSRRETTVPRPRAAAPRGSTVLPQLGVAMHFLWASWWSYQAEYTLDVAMGATWVRSDVTWSALQPTSTSKYSPIYLQDLDQRVAAAHSAGLHLLIVLLGTPAWAQPTGGSSVSPPTNPQDYANTLAFLAKRYNGQGVAFEIWNEPDLRQFMDPPDPTAYTNLACAAYRAIKGASPSTPVVAGSVSTFNRQFISGLFRAGLSKCMDAFSVHPYIYPPQAAAQAVSWQPGQSPWLNHGMAYLDSLLRQYGVPFLPIWYTEVGWSAASNDPASCGPLEYTLAEQASYTRSFLLYVATHFSNVPVVILYEGKDTTAASGKAAHMGLFTADLSPKPVVQAISALYQSPSSYPLDRQTRVPNAALHSGPVSLP